MMFPKLIIYGNRRTTQKPLGLSGKLILAEAGTALVGSREYVRSLTLAYQCNVTVVSLADTFPTSAHLRQSFLNR